jgi:hypothetical protein
METEYNQFLSMLDNVREFSPRVYGSKIITLNEDSHYSIVEMSSSVGRVVLGFSKTTGELQDIIGPLLLPRQGQEHEFCEDLGELDACAFQATAGRG